MEYVFVKDKGWTHESELKPGDQYRLKGGGWGTVEPERVLRTTQEHPFYVRGKGWTPLAEIRPGDVIRTDDGWVPVAGITDTGRCETVYNLRVADYHSYFVGAEDWGSPCRRTIRATRPINPDGSSWLMNWRRRG